MQSRTAAYGMNEKEVEAELRNFLLTIDKYAPQKLATGTSGANDVNTDIANVDNEVDTPADRMDPTKHAEIAKAKIQSAQEFRGSKNTRPGAKENRGKSLSEVPPESVVSEGILSAESILSASVLAPTGTPTVNVLEINATTVEKMEPLRHIQLTPSHQKLVFMLPRIQEIYGVRPLWAGADRCGNYYAMIDPLLLSSYIPYCNSVEDLSEEQSIECFHPLQEVDGYATIGGVPVWERQEWERIEYYNAFKLYRDMRYAFYNESDMLLTNRSIATLAKGLRVSASILSYLSKVYNWAYRVNLYDSWMQMMQERRRAVKRELMLDRHSKVAQALIQKSYQALSKKADQMSPKEALEMLRLGLSYERISAGLPGDRPVIAPGKGNTSQPLVNIVNQTNSGNGVIVPVNSEVTQQVQNNMKSNDTLLSILAVLQRSNAFKALVNGSEDAEAALLEDTDDVIDIEVGPVEEPSESSPSEAAPNTGAQPTSYGAGFAFNAVPKTPASEDASHSAGPSMVEGGC